ncbi:SARP family transcriptional regulator, partial [Solirubrobacter phytolaccae]|nr:SARP family transcriptional regulator [Solirubrobacter phytolaccae]
PPAAASPDGPPPPDASSPAPAVAAYRAAASLLPGAGMPGLERGLLPLALLSVGVVEGDFGPYEPWARPHVHLARGERGRAVAALNDVPDPPADLLQEALWALTAGTAAALNDRRTLERARAHLAPAAEELAGAGSGVLSFGPVAHYLGE